MDRRINFLPGGAEDRRQWLHIDAAVNTYIVCCGFRRSVVCMAGDAGNMRVVTWACTAETLTKPLFQPLNVVGRNEEGIVLACRYERPSYMLGAIVGHDRMLVALIVL